MKGGAEDRARDYLSRIAPGATLPRTLSAGPDERAPHGAFAVAQLFTHRRATGTVLIWAVYFMNLLNLYFLNSWLPTMISDADVPVATAIRLTALFQVGGIGGALVSAASSIGSFQSGFSPPVIYGQRSASSSSAHRAHPPCGSVSQSPPLA